MLQRIQSIYLALAGLGFGSNFLTDYAASSQPIPGMLSDQKYEIQDSGLLLALTILGIVIALAAIFLYNNRILQQRLSIGVVIFGVFLPAVALLLMFNEGSAVPSGVEVTEKAGLYLSVLPIVFGFLAYRGINKDEKLVRSMDRLR